MLLLHFQQSVQILLDALLAPRNQRSIKANMGNNIGQHVPPRYRGGGASLYYGATQRYTDATVRAIVAGKNGSVYLKHHRGGHAEIQGKMEVCINSSSSREQLVEELQALCQWCKQKVTWDWVRNTEGSSAIISFQRIVTRNSFETPSYHKITMCSRPK